MRRYAGELMCQRRAQAGGRIACGGSFTSDDDSSNNDISDGEHDNESDDAPECGKAKALQARQPSGEHVPLPNYGITLSWHVDQVEGYPDCAPGTIATRTVGAGTYRDFDKKRSAHLKKDCIAVTKHKCVEMCTPTECQYIAMGDYVELDVATDDGHRCTQIAEASLQNDSSTPTMHA